MRKIFVVLSIVSIFGCVDASRNMRELHSTQEREMTLGVVQREIRPGMSQGDVAAAIGSPNIVTNDSAGQDTWIYDRIATEASYSNSRAGLFGVGLGSGTPGTTLLLGLSSGYYDKNAGASATTEKTLTVVIKFDQVGRVESARYHSSKF